MFWNKACIIFFLVAHISTVFKREAEVKLTFQGIVFSFWPLEALLSYVLMSRFCFYVGTHAK